MKMSKLAMPAMLIPFVTSLVSMILRNLYIGIISLAFIFLFVKFCKTCRKRESLWIFILVALMMIPFNIGAIRSLFVYFEGYLELQWFVKAGVYPLIYIVMFSLEEIFCGIVGRIIWKRQYVLKWE